MWQRSPDLVECFPKGAVWPAVDDDSVQIREVYSRYGLAMYQAQVLEHGMVNAVIIARMLPTMRSHPDRSAWEDAFDQAYDLEVAKTFGNMLRALGPLDLPAMLLERLRAAKVDRDRLAHRFFREHDEHFLSASGRTLMIGECEDAIELFSRVDADLEEFIRPQRERFGITNDCVDRILAGTLKAAGDKSTQNQDLREA